MKNRAKGKKSQLLSFDFLVSIAILALALGVFLNAHMQLQRNAVGRIENPNAFAIAQSYLERLQAGETPESLGCASSGQQDDFRVVTCNSCAGGENFYFERRLYADQTAVVLLKTGVCP